MCRYTGQATPPSTETVLPDAVTIAFADLETLVGCFFEGLTVPEMSGGRREGTSRLRDDFSLRSRRC